MLKSWGLLGFDPDDKRDPFPRQKTAAKSKSSFNPKFSPRRK
jgi:hypothetical protein